MDFTCIKHIYFCIGKFILFLTSQLAKIKLNSSLE